ncbi:MAG: apolipoprotein N-acyltransferase [Bacteroidota bacterium]
MISATTNYASKKYWVYSLLSGLLLIIAWPPLPFAFLSCVGFVPLFFLAAEKIKKRSFFLLIFLSMLIWNIGTTWWVCNSTLIGGMSAIIVNSLLMCIPWMGYKQATQYFKPNTSLFIFVIYWLCFEHIHLNWELSWPWLTLGNVFANYTSFTQWYSFTGVGGGSLFVLLENVFIVIAIRTISAHTKWPHAMLRAASVLLLPISLYIGSSILLKNNTSSTSATKNMVAIQPNIDPYAKFSIETAASQISILLSLTEKAIDSNTVIVQWPETAMSVSEWQNLVTQNNYYQPIFSFIQKHPSLSLVSGIETYKNYGAIKETSTARRMNDGSYYDAFNAAVMIKANTPLAFYNKSKLVPGVESLPSFLNILAPLFEKFGGTTGGYGRSENAEVFTSTDTNYIAAPIICYESIYGDYIRSYVQQKATVLSIVTNDGWWGNTAGYKQHVAYAKLRAIENNRWVVRSANTGISAIIDNKGNIVDSLDWDKQGYVKATIPNFTNISFYTEYGDYIYTLATGITIILILFITYSIIVAKWFTKQSAL